MGSLASGAVGQAALVVTGVLTARTLGPTDRGYLALLVLLPTVLQLAGNVGLPLATTYFIARDRSHQRSVLRAIRLPCVIQVVALTALHGGLLWLLAGGYPQRVQWAALTTLPLLTFALADMYGKAILQGQGRYTALNILRNAVVGFYLVGVVVLFATGQTGIVEFTVAWVLATFLSAAVTLAYALTASPPEATPPKPGASESVLPRQLFRFGLKGYVASLSPVTTFRLDQALIGLFLAPEALGLYVAGLAFTRLPEIISRGVGMIALPHVASVSGSTRRADIRSFLVFSTVVTGAVVLALELVAGRLVPLFFGADFEEAVSITRILLVGSFFWGVRRIITDTATGSGRPGIGSLAELVSWVVIAPALLILMPIWDAEGVAAAMTISSAASLVALVVLLRRSGGPLQAVQGPGTTWRSRLASRDLW